MDIRFLMRTQHFLKNLEIFKLCWNMDHLFVLDGIIHNNRANVSQSPAVRSQSYTTQKENQYERQILNEIVFMSYNFYFDY